MSNVIYTSIPQLMTSCATWEARLALVQSIILKMMDAIDLATSTGTWEEYKLDTGQTKSEIRYRSLTDLERALDGMMKREEYILNKINYKRTGRQFRLVDGKNFPGRDWTYGW